MSYLHNGNMVILSGGKTDFRVRFEGFPRWFSQYKDWVKCKLHPKRRLAVSLGMELICSKCGHQYHLEKDTAW